MLSYEGPEGHEFTRTFRFSDFGVTVTIQPPDVSVQRDVTVDAVREEDVVIIDPVLRVVRGERKDGTCVLTVESERMPGEPPKLVRQNIGGQREVRRGLRGGRHQRRGCKGAWTQWNRIVSMTQAVPGPPPESLVPTK